jgi:hypothetical protein
MRLQGRLEMNRGLHGFSRIGLGRYPRNPHYYRSISAEHLLESTGRLAGLVCGPCFGLEFRTADPDVRRGLDADAHAIAVDSYDGQDD